MFFMLLQRELFNNKSAMFTTPRHKCNIITKLNKSVFFDNTYYLTHQPELYTGQLVQARTRKLIWSPIFMPPPQKKTKLKLSLKNLAMLPSFFIIFLCTYDKNHVSGPN